MLYQVHMRKSFFDEEETGEMTDEALLAASVRHPHLFAQIVRKYEAPFLRKAESIVHDSLQAQDIVQEAFTKIYLNAAKFQPQEGAQFSSWAWRILVNTALTHYMKMKRQGQAGVQLDEEIWAIIPDRDLRQFEKKELTDLVASVLSRMSPVFAAALSLFFMDGLSQEEIAEREQVSVGAVKTRVHRAKAEFRKIYDTLAAQTNSRIKQ